MSSIAARSAFLVDITGRNRRFAAALVIAAMLLAARRLSVAPKTVKTAEEYDIIIVGGGTSGCALASRLSENSNIRVLLLETGGSGQELYFVRTPSAFSRLFWNPRHVFQLKTEPQVYSTNKKHAWPRARLLGGCSSINAQMAQFGAPQDFDDWAAITGNDSWAWSNFRKYFLKFENFLPHSEYPDVDHTLRGTGGPVKVGYNSHITEASKAFIKACVGVGIPFTHDFNGPLSTLGVSRMMSYIDEKGKRVSAESAYLTRDVLARKNLTVVTHANVTRVVFEKQDGGVLRATGVEYVKNGNKSKIFKVTSRKEVIISAGAVHSPHLLMLSGIGPAAHLSEKGIEVLQDLPGVGQHLIDHPVVDIHLKDKTGDGSLGFLAPRKASHLPKVAKAVTEYLLHGTGPLCSNFGESAAFVRTDDRTLFPKNLYPEDIIDSTSGDQGPDLELFSSPFAYKEHGKVMFDEESYSLHCYLTRPLSRGCLTLKSADPLDLPIVDPKYLQHPADVKKLLRGTRLLLRIAQTDPFSSYLDHEYKEPELDHELHLKSDEEIIEVIKERMETVYHPTSTCRMAPLSEGGVVDSELNVYGIKGLRVCDASIFPNIISGHTAGACYAIAEKLADEIKLQF